MIPVNGSSQLVCVCVFAACIGTSGEAPQAEHGCHDLHSRGAALLASRRRSASLLGAAAAALDQRGEL